MKMIDFLTLVPLMCSRVRRIARASSVKIKT